MIRSIDSNRLSTFRTQHRFRHYAEFDSVAAFTECVAWGRQRGLPVLILGNGSNTLFASRAVRTLVLKNRLPKAVEPLGDHRFRVSSATPLSAVLKHCQKESRACFYYLASVPATVGGALAMNAGRGRDHRQSIYDFVESITSFDGAETVCRERADVPITYRATPFTGTDKPLILSAVFRFPPAVADADRPSAGPVPTGPATAVPSSSQAAGNAPANPVRDRIAWAKATQDHDAPNCGSVFKECHFGLMQRLRGLRLGGARFSPKTVNWLSNRGPSPRPLVWLIRIARLLHLIRGRRAQLELIVVK